MSDAKTANGLRPIRAPYDREKAAVTVASWDDVVAKLDKNAKYAVLYFSFGIRFALWDGTQFHSKDKKNKDHSDYLQLARIFDKSQELKVWRHDSQWRYRILAGEGVEINSDQDDKKEKEFNAVKAQQILWGTKTEGFATPIGTFAINGESQEFYWHTLTEDRGIKLVVPLPHNDLMLKSNEPKKRLAVTTYNYIDYLGNGLATYVDSRFVDIVLKS